MKMKILIIIAIFLVMIPWITGLNFDINNQVIVDGITTSSTIVMVLTITFSLLSWVLFSWTSKNIPRIGIPLSIITGTSLLIPFNQVLGPMAGIILGVIAGFTAFMLQKRIINSAQNTSLIIAVITIVVTYFVLALIILTITTSSHEWDMGYGVGAWTGTTEGMEQQAIHIIGTIISVGYALGVVVLLLFSVIYFILKRKNIPRKPYFIVVLAGTLVYFGITNLISFLQTFATTSSVIDYSQPYILDQLILSLMISIVELSIGGILLYRSSVIRKLIQK